MNDVMLRLEIERNVKRYCNRCSQCYSGYNDPTSPVSLRAKQILSSTSFDSKEDIRQSLFCFRPKEPRRRGLINKGDEV